ncbi:trypsin-1-like [Varroa destructor]|uniref:Peptidase S1 domain-containing protein n=1 Tax=Varroa destructor TaxID=109461 RepID=A0A7M7JZ47_VARDE|nr:trypsin-1-like [Varroa destructor]
MKWLYFILAFLPLGNITMLEMAANLAAEGRRTHARDIDSRHLRRIRRWKLGHPDPPGPSRPPGSPAFDSSPLVEVETRHLLRYLAGPGFGGKHHRHRRQRWGTHGFDGSGFDSRFGKQRHHEHGHRQFQSPHGSPRGPLPGFDEYGLGGPPRGPAPGFDIYGPSGPPAGFGEHGFYGPPSGLDEYGAREPSPGFYENSQPISPTRPGHHHINYDLEGPQYTNQQNYQEVQPGAVLTFQDKTQGQSPVTTKPILRFQSSCGVSTTSRIVGGEQVHGDNWSWTVALMRPADGGMEQFCGATLISDQHMITAAHCIANMKPYAMTARIGYTNLDEADGSQDLRIGTAKLHPHYNSSNYYADIAILKLQQPVQFSTRLQPCCLPDARDNTGRIAIAVGWGSTAFGGPQTNVLQQVTLPIWSNQECQDKINIAVFDEMLCAGRKDEGGHDACQGDSGGPLLVRNSEQRWSLEGIISFGFKCAQKGVPGVYTRVSKFSDWIIDNAV